MVTRVGLQENFSDSLIELIELDYDAIEAYESAINRLDNHFYKSKLEDFKQDHDRHVQELSNLLQKHGYEPPSGPSGKQWLTKGKVVLANLVGDKMILKAMKSNELDTNIAYETMNDRDDMWSDAKGLIARALKDEHRHKAWLEATIKNDLEEKVL